MEDRTMPVLSFHLEGKSSLKRRERLFLQRSQGALSNQDNKVPVKDDKVLGEVNHRAWSRCSA